VSEEQLNEVYNLMDVYCHPFTSGGQEIPIQEAKLVELMTLVTNYSCGEEMCEEEAASIPLEWSENREILTQFKKASTDPKSISKQLRKVFNMKESVKSELGRKARKWVVDNFSVEVIGGRIEKFLDDCPFADYDFNFQIPKKKPDAVIPEARHNRDFVTSLYKEILLAEGVSDDDQGHKYWMEQLSKGATRESVEKYFRNVAANDNKKLEKTSFESMLGKDDAGKRMLIVIPQSIGDVFLITALFESAKDQYPEYNLYVATKPEFQSVLMGNPHV